MEKEKKEIWMEKLIELLNECTNKQALHIRMSEPYKWVYLQYDETFTVNIISKKFWFIKWLVENDKIDREKFWNSETKSSKYSDFDLSYDTPREDYTNTLLVELSIQDEPIQFLIGILR